MKKFNNDPLSSSNNNQQPTTTTTSTSAIKLRAVPIRRPYEKKHEVKTVEILPYQAISEPNKNFDTIESVRRPIEISDKEYLSHLKNRTMGRRSSTRERERSLKRQASTSEKKTRWLLTRKTWRYMADAGRKLIPDGISNKPENLAKIEDHFQKLCANEKKFLIWKRKLSYPGACSSFRRKNKTKISKKPVTFGSPTTGSSADECDDERTTKSKRSDELIIKMLERYLSIGSDIEECESEPNSSKASSVKDQNNNLNNSRTSNSNNNNNKLTSSLVKYGDNNDNNNLDYSKSAVLDQSIWHPSNFNETMHSSLLLDSLTQYRKKNYSPYIEVDTITTDLLKDKVLLRKILNDIRTQQKYSKIPRTESTRSLNISYSSSMSSLTSTISSTFHNFVDYIDNKASSCRNSLYRQAPTITSDNTAAEARISSHKDSFQKLPDPLDFGSKLSLSPSLTSLSKTHEIYNQQKQIFASKQQQQLYQHQQQMYQKQQQMRASANLSAMKTSTTLKSITTKTTNTTTTLSTSKQQQKIHTKSESHLSSMIAPVAATSTITSSSQPTTPTTKNVPLIAVKKASYEKIPKDNGTQTDGIPLNQLNLLYEDYKKKLEEEKQYEDEESQSDSATATAVGAAGGATQSKANRKSSIDNKDVSQSVSDTIKRYLNMARKKPKDNDAANRFKRVNYDRNLRNIKAKGEITKPGDDDGLMKGCQTESNWLEVLFHNPIELNRCCTSPIYSPISSPDNKSPPSTSPPPSLPSSPPSPSTSSGIGSGIIHSSTQFLSNLLWHHTNSNTQQITSEAAIAMQKSKSSSNVGHLVSKKIFRSRSKSQTRVQSSPVLTPSVGHGKPTWTPQGNCVWVSDNGRRAKLRDVFLPNLTEVERIILEKIAQEKAQQLGITISPQEISTQAGTKPQKRRTLLLKRKAVTTGFFDNTKGKEEVASKGGLVFGLPLEQCIENENRLNNQKSTPKENRSARSSLSSLVDHQQREQSGSCESLPAKTSDSEYLNSTYLPLFHTNLDRRSSHDDDDLALLNIAGVQHSHVQQVPSLVLSCTKYLEENGLNTVGIFRVSTSKKRVRQLREDFDKGIVTNIDPTICPHDIATLLKEFFRDLPEPLLCRHLYKGFLQTQTIRNRRLQLECISHMIRLLPVAHRDTLYVLLKFLGKVARAASDTTTFDGQVLSFGNKMDSHNLATIIAPNVLHCIKSDQLEEQEIAERADVINIIRIMIDHYEDMFIVPAEDMNEIYTNMMDIYPQQLDYLLDRLYIRQEEEIDSPPMSPPFNQGVFSDDEKILSPTATTTISTMESPKRIVYSREDILHENAAKGGGSAYSLRRAKEREYRIRTKYQDPEKTVRRRRQSDRDDLSSSSSTTETYMRSSGISVGGDRDYIRTISTDDYQSKTRSSSMDSNSSDVFDMSNRRLSSPLTSHTAGVVTASLKIPVQMQSNTTIQSSSSASGQNVQVYIQEKSNQSSLSSSHNIGDNITGIPFIEDSSASVDYSDEYTKKNTSNLSSRQSVMVTSKRLDEVQTINVPVHQHFPKDEVKLKQSKSKDQIVATSTMSTLASSKIPMKKLIEPKKPVSTIQSSASASSILRKNIATSSSMSYSTSGKTVRDTNSNYTPSITNIGGAVLRSKTADLERLFDQTKKSRISSLAATMPTIAQIELQPSPPSRQPPQSQPQSPSVTNINISLTTKKKSLSDSVSDTTSASDSLRKGPIYKRQELISSVHSKSTKK